jgi:hypothetical protein
VAGCQWLSHFAEGRWKNIMALKIVCPPFSIAENEHDTLFNPLRRWSWLRNVLTQYPNALSCQFW